MDISEEVPDGEPGLPRLGGNLPMAQPPMGVDDYMEGNELAMPAGDAADSEYTTESKAEAKNNQGKVLYYCQCRFAEPLTRKLRCSGCRWTYRKDQLSSLRSLVQPDKLAPG